MAKVRNCVLDTNQVAPRERFRLWRDVLAATHEVTLPEDCDPASFSARARSQQVGNELLVLEARHTPQHLVRTARAIRSDQIDHYIVRLQCSGHWTGELGGRTVRAGPGSVMVLDMARPSNARTSEIKNINLLLPRDALDDVLTPFDLHGLLLPTPMAAVLGSHIAALAAQLTALDVADARRLAGVTLRLVAACLAPSREALAQAREPIEAALLAQVRRYVDSHLTSRDLSPSTIGAALGLSRSTLYAVCEPMGGVAAFIQKRRLKRIRAALADPSDRRRIAEIAFQFGFSSEAHFSRVFRRTFGCTPRDARHADIARLTDTWDAATPDGYATLIRQLGT